jgi:hypothetical protein
MPNKRHGSLQSLGATTQGNFTATVVISESFTMGTLHLWGGGAVVDMNCSPDGGTTWCNFLRPNGIRMRYTLATARRSFGIPVMPTMLRALVTTANLSGGYVEGSREVG